MRRPRGGDERSSRTRAAPRLRPGPLGVPARSSLTAAGEAGRVGSERLSACGGRGAERAERPARSRSRKRGPAPEERRRVWRAERRHVPETVRDYVQTTRRLARHPLDISRGEEREDGLPGAAKNTGGDARLLHPSPLWGGGGGGGRSCLNAATPTPTCHSALKTRVTCLWHVDPPHKGEGKEKGRNLFSEAGRDKKEARVALPVPFWLYPRAFPVGVKRP